MEVLVGRQLLADVDFDVLFYRFGGVGGLARNDVGLEDRPALAVGFITRRQTSRQLLEREGVGLVVDADLSQRDPITARDVTVIR